VFTVLGCSEERVELAADHNEVDGKPSS